LLEHLGHASYVLNLVHLWGFLLTMLLCSPGIAEMLTVEIVLLLFLFLFETEPAEELPVVLIRRE